MTDVMLDDLGFGDVNPYVCGHEPCEPGHTFGPAERGYYLLHYVIEGQGEFCSPRGWTTVKKDQIFVIRPHEMTVYSADMQNPWVYAWVGFYTKLPIEELLSRDCFDAPGCLHLFQEMVEAHKLIEGRELFVAGKVFELLSLLTRLSGLKTHGPEYSARMAVNYIRSYYMQPLSVELLAAKLNLDRSYFSAIFKRHTGKSPQQYIVDYRLNKAAELIAARIISPSAAALRVGYTNPSNFSRMFKRRFGVPPNRYHAVSRDDAPR